MNNRYVIVKHSFEVPTEVYYANTLEDAEIIRNNRIAFTDTGWKIYTEAESLSRSRFWRWLTNFAERINS